MKLTKLLGALLIFGAGGPAFAIKFSFKGDLDNRVMGYTNQATLYAGSETIGTLANPATPINPEGIEEMWGEVKYRLQAEAATDDNSVKGVYGMEIGAIRFGFNVSPGTGAPASTGRNAGGNFSGDGVNVETRFAYLEFGIPTPSPRNLRATFGLQPVAVNKFLWQETAMGLKLRGDFGIAGVTLSWLRGIELFNSTLDTPLFADADNFLGRVDVEPQKDVKAGFFALYQHRSPDVNDPTATNRASNILKNFGPVNYNFVNLGVDATVTAGQVFGGIDFIYQVGSTDNFGTPRLDASAFLGHLDLGVNVGQAKVTYTGWYASGDDDPTDDTQSNFVATDVDIPDSIIFFEGGYTNDNFFTEAPYFLNKGAFFNKLAVEYKPTGKLTLGLAGLYVMTAQDLTLGNGDTSRTLGTEIDALVTYKLNDNLEFGANAGYLFSADGMDAFETEFDGDADANIFRATGRVRYTF